MNIQSVKQRFGIIGSAQALEHALATAVRVAPTELSVLITGESGVGKEVFSKIIHGLSPRKHNNFIAVNCGAIPAGTINSELFGHEKGAFTGATADRKGYFETVDGGTIFLDEIGEMPSDTQSFLLRVLESGEFIRVGSSRVQTTNVRVIAATNKSLLERIEKGKFREDLYYRLNTVPIFVPPLRERQNDIYLLFRKFAVDFAERYRMDVIQLDESARSVIKRYHWPGNIRELKNLAEQLSVMSTSRHLNAEMLLEHAPHLDSRSMPAIRKLNDDEPLSYKERELFYKLMFEMKGDLTELKNLVFELIRSNDLNIPDTTSMKLLSAPAVRTSTEEVGEKYERYRQENGYSQQNADAQPEKRFEKNTIKIESDESPYDEAELIEEVLSIEEMEKDLIGKALKKHTGRRKEAAAELGISERTLYRKIKQYDL